MYFFLQKIYVIIEYVTYYRLSYNSRIQYQKPILKIEFICFVFFFCRKSNFFFRKLKFLSKVGISVENRNYCRKLNFFPITNFLSKIEIFVENRNFLSKIQFYVKNPKCLSKIQIFTKSICHYQIRHILSIILFNGNSKIDFTNLIYFASDVKHTENYLPELDFLTQISNIRPFMSRENLNVCWKPKFLFKIDIFVETRIYWQKSKFLSKIKNFVQNQIFCRKIKILSKFLSETEIFDQNRNFYKKIYVTIKYVTYYNIRKKTYQYQKPILQIEFISPARKNTLPELDFFNTDFQYSPISVREHGIP